MFSHEPGIQIHNILASFGGRDKIYKFAYNCIQMLNRSGAFVLWRCMCKIFKSKISYKFNTANDMIECVV